MDLSNTPDTRVRHDGWTAERRTRFLDRLAQDGNVLASCALVGLSREAAYQLKRRDPVFARAWAAAQALAREASAEVLGTRAIEGIAEDVWYRGEVVGTRRRYDNRLLLAHVARLDKLAEADPTAVADAARFDELLARVAGVEIPEGLRGGDGHLPPTRFAHVKAACAEADRIADRAVRAAELANVEAGMGDYVEGDEWDTLDAKLAADWDEAYTGAVAEWDTWFAAACATVDRLLAPPAAGERDGDVRTLSGLSSSGQLHPGVSPAG